ASAGPHREMRTGSVEGNGDQPEFCWDAICITARVPSHAEAYKRELQRRGLKLLAPDALRAWQNIVSSMLIFDDPFRFDGCVSIF
ncbi:unnamed protein product, partial [Polarella glacialis]